MSPLIDHIKNNDAEWVGLLRRKASSLFMRYSLPRWMVFLLDMSGVVLTFFVAYILRYNFEQSSIDYQLVFYQSLVVLISYGLFEWIYRSYSGLLRHSTIGDVNGIVLSTSISLLTLLALVIINRLTVWINFLNIPLSILLIQYVTLNVLMLIVRIFIKLIYEISLGSRSNAKNVVIYGAGTMGVMVRKVITLDRDNELNIIAFVDRSKKLHKKILDGVPVISPATLNDSFIEMHGLQAMIFAIHKIPAQEKSEVFSWGLDMGLEVLDIPPANKWLNGQFRPDQLKKIKLEDLLGREPIRMDQERVGLELQGKVVMVTGAAGSIGSEISRQLCGFDVKKLVLIDNAETPLFHLDRKLQDMYYYDRLIFSMTDVTDGRKMRKIFEEHEPDMVFHAAAYKHVPLLESNPQEAIRVNVGSTRLISDLSIEFGVSRFVLVSTDKAVNPTNVMGTSKRMSEMIVQTSGVKQDHETSFIITRFGNVLGSNGSVIPIFQQQIERGGPVTVTHPEVTRYFMTISEACQLVLEAGNMGHGGEIFVFDMGNPVKIDDLARRMIRLSGFTPDKDIQIHYSGLRPGEKLYEELLTSEEKTMKTYHPKVRIAEAHRPEAHLRDAIIALMEEYCHLTREQLILRLKQIVPEYQPDINGDLTPSEIHIGQKTASI